MAYCPTCGEEIQPNAAFCSSCGSEVTLNHNAVTGDSNAVKATEGKSDDEAPAEQGDSIFSRWNTNQKGVMAGGVLGAVSAFLPWLSLTILGTSLTMYGIDGDGVFSLVLAVVCILAAAYTWNKWVKGLVVLAGLGVFGIGLLYIMDPLAGINLAQFTFQEQQILRNSLGPKIGIYGTFLSGIVLLGSVILDHI